MTKEHFAPMKTRPSLAPKQFDPTAQTFVPDLSITDSKIHDISTRKLKGVGAKIYHTTAQTIADDGAFHDLIFDAENFDQGDLFDAAVDNTTIVLPYAGVWLVTGFVSWEPNATGNRFLRLQLNGNTFLKVVVNNAGGVVDTDMPVLTTFVSADAGGEITMQAKQGSGGDLDINGGGSENFLAAVYQFAI